MKFFGWSVNSRSQRILRSIAEILFQIHFTSTIIKGNKIKLWENVWKSFALSNGCYIQGGNGIYIGDDTIFASGVKIVSANHDPMQGMARGKAPAISIGSRGWIGANAVILPEVELGDDCIVSAGTVVTHSFTAGQTLVGVPCRPVTKA
jgi:acetyltransferase-like isoleucine patch superfamily enzyme